MIDTNKIVGIIGGMGPMATIDLFSKVVVNTKASTDQEHIHLLIDNNTNIPDRSAHILGSGINPIKELYKSAKRLIDSGASMLAMPCNTAHYYYDELTDMISSNIDKDILFINMIEETADYLYAHGHRRVFLLGTQGTYKSGIYDQILKKQGIESLNPRETNREIIMECIYNYKGGKRDYTSGIAGILGEASKMNASAIILACTELPLIFKDIKSESTIIDPSLILAKAIINKYSNT